jgi:hypothetical protein
MGGVAQAGDALQYAAFGPLFFRKGQRRRSAPPFFGIQSYIFGKIFTKQPYFSPE